MVKRSVSVILKKYGRCKDFTRLLFAMGKESSNTFLTQKKNMRNTLYLYFSLLFRRKKARDHGTL